MVLEEASTDVGLFSGHVQEQRNERETPEMWRKTGNGLAHVFEAKWRQAWPARGKEGSGGGLTYTGRVEGLQAGC